MNIFKMELKLKFKGFLTWMIIMLLFILALLVLFPSYQPMYESLNDALLTLPPAMLAALGMVAVDFTKIMEYYAYCHQYILLAGSIYAFMLGTKALVTEESEKTIEFLYAKPVSRTKIFAEKMFAAQVLFFIFGMAQAVVTGVLAVFYKEAGVATMEVIMDILRIYVSYLLIGYTFMGFGILLSSVMRSVNKASSTALGIFFVMYFLGMLSNISTRLSFLRYVAPLEYLRPRDMINSGRVDFFYFFIAAFLIGIFYSMAYLLYNNKDLKT